MNKAIKILICIIMICGVSACNNDNKNDASSAVSFIDSVGTEINLAKIPEKIIALMPSDVEILFKLEVSDKLVAISEYSEFPIETADIKKIGTGTNMNLEEIIALSPDLVIFGYMAQTDEQIKQLTDSNIAVMTTRADTIADVMDIVEMLGKAVGKQSKAEAVNKELTDGLQAIKEKYKDKSTKNVYVEISSLAWGLYTVGNDTFIGELLSLINVENSFGDSSGWVSLSEEQVIEQSPDIIITTDINDDAVSEIMNRAGWGSISAIQNHKVYAVPANIAASPSPRMVDAAQAFADVIYGK